MTFKVWSPPHTMFAARLLAEHLKLQGHTADVVPVINPADKDIYIIYCACKVHKLPKNYIVYQTEIQGSPWFTKKYYETIAGAVCVWDYSEHNIAAYRQYNNRIAIVPPGIAPQVRAVKDIPVLFYGWVDGSPRRQKLLAAIQKHTQVKVVSNALQGQMWNLLSRSKIVLNLHFYDNSPLETFRINEALSFNCHVISESSSAGDKPYKKLITFADTVESIRLAIDAHQNKEFKKNILSLDNRMQIREGLKLL